MSAASGRFVGETGWQRLEWRERDGEMVQRRGQAVVIQTLEAKSMRPQVPEATFVGQRGRREGFLQGFDDEMDGFPAF